MKNYCLFVFILLGGQLIEGRNKEKWGLGEPCDGTTLGCNDGLYCDKSDDTKPLCKDQKDNAGKCNGFYECKSGYCHQPENNKEGDCTPNFPSWEQTRKREPLCEKDTDCGAADGLKFVKCEIPAEAQKLEGSFAYCREIRKLFQVAQLKGQECKNDSDCTTEDAQMCMPARLVCRSKAKNSENPTVTPEGNIYILSTKKTLSKDDNCTHNDQCRYGLHCFKSKCVGDLEIPPDSDAEDSSGWKLNVNFVLVLASIFLCVLLDGSMKERW